MSEATSRTQTVVGVLKDVVAALRDSVLFLVFLLLLCSPGTVNERLTQAGFTKGSIGGFEWEAQIKTATETTKSAGQTVAEARESYDQIVERLGAIESKISDPALKSEIKDLGAVATNSRSELASADLAIKRSLVAQQQIVTQIRPSAVEDSGWIFLGKITEDKNAWMPGSPQTVQSAEPDLPQGTALVVRDDVYLRGEAPSHAHASAAVLAVARVGETVEVLSVDHSHARGGGWFVWAKVKRR
jgi:hypothetical protein